MGLSNITKVILGMTAAMCITGCSTVAEVDLALAGSPETPFDKQAVVTTKFMKPADVSKACTDVIARKSILPNWYHACSYKRSNGEIVMIMPIPGTISPATYGKVIFHEYQHVGQAIESNELGHSDWR